MEPWMPRMWSPEGTPGSPGPCPFTVDKPVMRQRWEAADVPALALRPGPTCSGSCQGALAVDTLDGAAWVGLVPFLHAGPHPGRPRRPPGSQTSARPMCAPTYGDRDGRARHLVPVTGRPRASGQSRWPGPATSCRTSGPRCGSPGRSPRTPPARVRRPGRGPGDHLFLPAPAAGAAPGGQPGARPRGCAVPARRNSGTGTTS